MVNIFTLPKHCYKKRQKWLYNVNKTNLSYIYVCVCVCVCVVANAIIALMYLGVRIFVST